MKNIKIKDLYTGKPDAKDEIIFLGDHEFIKTFLVADYFNIDSLLNGHNCFITGFKGTGKTALLFYLDNLLKLEDESACSSFVFFKEEFTNTKKNQLGFLSNKILSSISIDKEVLVDESEFEYIWRWLFFKRIVSDNEEYSNNLFEDNLEWATFAKIIDQIKDPANKKKSVIPNKIKIATHFTDPSTLTTISPEIEIDLQNGKDQNYIRFTSIIDDAEKVFVNLKRTNIPYYIFVDELEAYYGEDVVFKRDLCLIRDLIFTVKRFNMAFSAAKMQKTKMICSVRSEILNSISRFIVTKELNKLTSGFSVQLAWNYNNTSSYMHPIVQILLKRIAVCEDGEFTYKDIYKKWFPEPIHGIEPASYILNNCWCKPRDVVRLLTTAQNSINNSSSVFSQAVFNNIIKQYSEDSLIEIKEEMRALYDPEQIDTIINCFMGYKTSFSVKQLKERIHNYFPNSILNTNFVQIVNDLYRLGFLGNFLPISKSYRWQHKGDDRVILTDEWRLMVHYAIQSALSLGSQQDYGLNRGEEPQTGDVTIATVNELIHNFALVEFKHYGVIYQGSIHIKEFTKLGYGYIRNIQNIVPCGSEYKVALIDFNSNHQRWNLQILVDETESK